ncbi:DNA primase [Phenylobacterium sp. LjRoot225]|uniref:LPD7 domain-containing protein n=1 Tax=Phenylobacterium sp. LjRoot225 TaxID=3342285 RepID=UPI003ECE3FBA
MADETDTGTERTVTPPAPPQATAEAPKRRRGSSEVENSIEPTQERTAERAPTTADPSRDNSQGAPPPTGRKAAPDKDKAANDDDPDRFSVQRGDVPDALKRRYFSDEPQFAAELRFYTDAKTKEPAFRDTGDKLVARQTSADVVKDLVAIAEHRGWKAIDVKGQEDFRREVWLEARTAGLEVRGYKPSERDVQELERRLNARDVNSLAPSRDRYPNVETANAEPTRGKSEGAPEPSAAVPKPERLDYDKGLTGKLVEIGEQPYKHRAGQELAPFVRVEQPSGRQVEVWGVGLPAALERSGAKIGDDITLRRDGVEMVSKTVEVKDKDTGEVSFTKREVPRNRWTIDAERFRDATPTEAARDPDLRDAQSRLAVVAAVVKDRHPDDTAVQERLIAGAKEKIASHIEQGAKFPPVTIREAETAKERSPIERTAAAEGERGTPPEVNKTGPERTRGR